MASHVHYEVFRRLGSKDGWTLHDVVHERDGAIALAQTLKADGQAKGVKVVKETYNDGTGDYLTLKIFEDDLVQMKTPPAAEDVPHVLPCFTPDDLYSYHARATMARVLTDFLTRNKVTITELIHRGDLLEQLEAAGTQYQHAVQKVAVAQAAATAMPVQQIIRSLDELATKAIQRVYRDERRHHFPEVAPDAFGAFASRIAAETDGAYVLNGAIARLLKDASSWDEKVLRLLALMEVAPDNGPGRTLLIAAVDTIVAEVLSSSAALHELIAANSNLGAALMNLVRLFLGNAPEGEADGRAGLTALTRCFVEDRLPTSRAAIADRIIVEIKSVKRLRPDSLVDELKALRQIANRVVLGLGKYMSHEDLIAAFTLRSRRLVTFEALSAHLADAATPDEKVERILFVEDNVIGLENKRQLSAFLLPIIKAAPFENYFLDPKLPILSRLQRLATMQLRVLRSSMQERQREEIAAVLDRIAAEAETRARFLESIEAKSTGPVDKAIALLRLCTGRALTEGKLSSRARALVLGHLSRPGFLNGYIAHLATGTEKPTPDAARDDLVEALKRAGITSETGLKSIAA